MKKLVWPPNSLDLDPIENLCKIVENLLHHHNIQKNKQEMHNHMQAVIFAKDRNTK